MDIRINKYTLDKKTDKENLALVDTWMADTVDKLNAYIQNQNRVITELQNQLKEIRDERKDS